MQLRWSVQGADSKHGFTGAQTYAHLFFASSGAKLPVHASPWLPLHGVAPHSSQGPVMLRAGARGNLCGSERGATQLTYHVLSEHCLADSSLQDKAKT